MGFISESGVSWAWLAGAALSAGLAVAGPQTAIAAAIEDNYVIINNTDDSARWQCTGCSVRAKPGYPQTNFTASDSARDSRGGRSNGRLAPSFLDGLVVTATYRPFNYQTARINFTQQCGTRPCNNSNGVEAYKPATWSVTFTQAVIGAPYVTTTGNTSGPNCGPVVACTIRLKS